MSGPFTLSSRLDFFKDKLHVTGKTSGNALCAWSNKRKKSGKECVKTPIYGKEILNLYKASGGKLTQNISYFKTAVCYSISLSLGLKRKEIEQYKMAPTKFPPWTIAGNLTELHQHKLCSSTKPICFVKSTLPAQT